MGEAAIYCILLILIPLGIFGILEVISPTKNFEKEQNKTDDTSQKIQEYKENHGVPRNREYHNVENVTRNIELEEIETLLKDDLIENSKIYFLLWRHQIHFIKYNQNLLHSYNIVVDEANIYNTFLELYRLSLEAEGLSHFKDILSKERTRIIKQKLRFVPKKSSDFDFSADQLLAFQCNEKCELHNDLITTDTWLELEKENVKDIIDIQIFDRAATRNDLIQCMLASIEALVISIVLYREKQKIVNNNEFYCLMKNIFSEFNLDVAQEKIYEMYANFYANVLSERYSSNDFKNLVEMMYTSEMLISPYRVKTQLEIKEDLVNYEDIYRQICTIVENDKDEYERSTLERLYLLNLGNRVSTSSVSSVFYTLLKVINISDDVENYLKRKRLESDKQRYLAGDFTKERDIEKESIKLSNVSTGIEFEGYLKNLFEKLGYIVETTRVSGDQGADLIISKDGIKTAVQAKFYSSKVGNKAVQEVVSAIKYYNVDSGMVVTNNYYTSSAINLAHANNITLIDGDNLKELINKIGGESQDINNDDSSVSDFNPEKFLSESFDVGNCLYQNKVTKDFDCVKLTLSEGYLIIENIEDDFRGEKVLIYTTECNLISHSEDTEDTEMLLISIGDEWLGMSELQYDAVKSYIEFMNTLTD